MLAEQEGMSLVFKMEGMVGRMLRVLKPLPLDLHSYFLLVGTIFIGSLANIGTPPIGASIDSDAAVDGSTSAYDACSYATRATGYQSRSSAVESTEQLLLHLELLVYLLLLPLPLMPGLLLDLPLPLPMMVVPLPL